MQRNRSGIPVNVSVKRNPLRMNAKKESHRKRKKTDYECFNTFATLVGTECGCVVYSMIPVAHPDFKKAKAAGMKVIEVWEKQDKDFESNSISNTQNLKKELTK